MSFKNNVHTKYVVAADSQLQGTWTADHPPIPVPIQHWYGELENEFMLVESMSGKTGTWSYRIITMGPDSPEAIDGFQTKNEAMLAAEKDVLEG